MDFIKNSDIIDNCDKIFLCANGDIDSISQLFDEFIFFNLNKVEVLHLHDDVNYFEFTTLNYLKQFCELNECKILYIHTKGASHYEFGENCKKMISILCNSLIGKYQEHLQNLNYFDASGAALYNEPFLHYTCNFWWSKSSFLKNLDLLKYHEENFDIAEKFQGSFASRHAAEIWLGSKGGNFSQI